jgi:predicted ATPase
LITRIEARAFRSLRYVDQQLAPFQVLVGPNGAGKSNFLDVIAFLGDLLHVGPLRAITGDAAAGVPSRAADPSHLFWMRRAGRFELAVELRIPAERVELLARRYHHARYEVAVHVGHGEVTVAAETLWLLPESAPDSTPSRQLDVFPRPRQDLDSIRRETATAGWRQVVSKTASGNDYFRGERSEWKNQFRLGPARSALANLPEDETRFPVATWVKRVLMEGMRRVVLRAEAMRNPSPPGSPPTFLPDGSNLPWVVERLRREDEKRFDQWVDHVRTAVPDLGTVKTVEREEDRHRYLVVEYESGLQAPSWLVSDGTLRLLALTLLAYLPQPDALYLIEEPENGVHPRAVETVYTSLSSVYDAQVLCASHSPVILGLASPDDLLVFAKDKTGATDVVRGSEHPRLRDWQGDLDLGVLFAAGVLG